MSPVLAEHMFYVRSASKRLARHVIYQMICHQKKLESKQSVLNRVVGIGTELFAMASTCAYAQHLLKNGDKQENSVELADLFCRTARDRIDVFFKESKSNHDKQSVSVAKKVLAKDYEWLESEIIK